MVMLGGHGGGTARRAGSERLGHALGGEDLADGEHGSQASDEGATVHASSLLDLLRLARGAANRPTAIAIASPIRRMGTSVGDGWRESSRRRRLAGAVRVRDEATSNVARCADPPLPPVFLIRSSFLLNRQPP